MNFFIQNCWDYMTLFTHAVEQKETHSKWQEKSSSGWSCGNNTKTSHTGKQDAVCHWSSANTFMTDKVEDNDGWSYAVDNASLSRKNEKLN